MRKRDRGAPTTTGASPALKRVLFADYQLPTAELAKRLLGVLLVRWEPYFEEALVGRIVETEAYLGIDDPACHSYKGHRSERNESMYQAAGTAYVYFTYGAHYMLNVVSAPEGTAEAVLIRALEPLAGLKRMQRNRKVGQVYDLTSGPAKLTQALEITKELDGVRLDGDARLGLYDIWDTFTYCAPPQIGVSGRVGIKQAADWPYRFFWEGSPFVS